MRYAVVDILKLAGVENPEEVVGKFSVRIGGINVNKLDKVINVQDAKTVDVLVGVTVKTVELPEEQSEEHKSNLEALKKLKGEESCKAIVDKAEARIASNVE